MEEEFNYTKEVLQRATEYGLEVEVIYSALRELKTNPKLTISEALIIGLEEWDL